MCFAVVRCKNDRQSYAAKVCAYYVYVAPLRILYTNIACTQTHSRDEIPSSTLVKTKASSIKREAAMAGRHAVTAGVIISRCGLVIIFLNIDSVIV